MSSVTGFPAEPISMFHDEFITRFRNKQICQIDISSVTGFRAEPISMFHVEFIIRFHNEPITRFRNSCCVA